MRLKVEGSRRDDAADDHEKGDRPVFQPELAGNEDCQCSSSHQQRNRVRVAEVCEEIRRAFPEVAVRAFEAKQLRQLCRREIESQTGLEADENRLGKEADDVARAHEPCGESERRHDQRDALGHGRMTRGIAAAQLAHGCANEQRQC
jgi:hypothetical protein